MSFIWVGRRLTSRFLLRCRDPIGIGRAHRLVQARWNLLCRFRHVPSKPVYHRKTDWETTLQDPSSGWFERIGRWPHSSMPSWWTELCWILAPEFRIWIHHLVKSYADEHILSLNKCKLVNYVDCRELPSVLGDIDRRSATWSSRRWNHLNKDCWRKNPIHYYMLVLRYK